MGFHAVGPLAVAEGAVLTLPRKDRQQQLGFQQTVNALAGGAFKPRENQMQRVRVVFGADAALVRPGVTILVYPAMDQVAVEISGPSVAGVRAEKKVTLYFDGREYLQLV